MGNGLYDNSNNTITHFHCEVMMKKLKNEKLAFTRETDYRGFNIKAFWGDGGNARIEIIKDGKVYREFLFPAYKIYNLQAHFEDIVDGELQNSDAGYRIAASTGLEGLVK